MRKVTEQTAVAFRRGESKAVGNTMTNGTHYYLHGNLIAYKNYGGLMLTLAGWNTVTTRERLNGILNVFGVKARFSQKDYAPVFVFGDDKPIKIESDQIIRVNVS